MQAPFTMMRECARGKVTRTVREAAMGNDQARTPLYPADRLDKAAMAAKEAGFGALLLTPGPDLRYVIGYDAHQLERLTCLAVPAERPPFLVVPRLELAAAMASPAGQIGLAVRMWALMTLRLRDALPAARQGLASAALRGLRIRKSAAEVAALGEAADAIDRVHARVPGWLQPGRTEREVAADIADAIIGEGHDRADFTIVASGPNAASPHHGASDRMLAPGDAVVVDIGGTMPSGYCSDCTRTYVIGAPPPGFAAYYQVLKDAQEAACAAVRPGVSAEAVDAAAREPIAAAGYGEQ